MIVTSVDISNIIVRNIFKLELFFYVFSLFCDSFQDRYILGSMTFLYLICVWHAIVVTISDIDIGKQADKWAFVSFTLIFAIFQIAYFISVLVQVSNFLIFLLTCISFLHLLCVYTSEDILKHIYDSYTNTCMKKGSPKTSIAL